MIGRELDQWLAKDWGNDWSRIEPMISRELGQWLAKDLGLFSKFQAMLSW